MSDQGAVRPRPEGRRRRRPHRGPVVLARRAGLVTALLGVPAGLVWWLLAPGGFRGAGESYLDLVQASGAAVGAFALVCLVSGALVGVGWVLVREEEHDTRAVARLVGVLLGGAVGAALAWGAGALLQVLLPAPLPDLPAEVTAGLTGPRPSLGALAAALLWPLATGVLVIVDTLREVIWQSFGSHEAHPGSRRGAVEPEPVS